METPIQRIPASLSLHSVQKKGLWLALLCVGLLSCTKEPVPVEITRLQAQLAASEKQLVDLDGELKTAKDDPVQLATLTEDKELLKSRIERIKQHLIALGALTVAPEGGGAHGGGGGGGGHH